MTAMSSSTVRRRLPTVSLRVFRMLTLAGVVLLALIVVTGGAVRLTGSGLGCPTWPQCGDGSWAPRPQYAGHGWVEFGNRLISVAVGVLMLALPLVALRLADRRRDLVMLSFGLWVGFLGQVVLGGLTVRFDLNPALVAGHFLLSMLLLWDVVVLDRRARAGAGRAHPAVGRELRWLARVLSLAAAAVLVLGTVVTGTGPHSGDSARAKRFGFDITTVAQLHADGAMLLTGLVIATAFAVRLGRAPAEARRTANVLVGTVVGQAGVGFAQYFTGVPASLVGLHIAGATLLWVVTLRLSLAMVARPPAAPAGTVVEPSGERRDAAATRQPAAAPA
jgi:cytochrome c oxidase assembly protein subunit 15